MAVHRPRIGNQDGDWHLLVLHFLLCRWVELEHATFVTQVYFLFACVIAERQSLSQGPGWFRVRIEQEVADMIEPNLFLLRVVIDIDRVDEQHPVTNFLIAGEAKVQVDLFVVFPDVFLFLVGRLVRSVLVLRVLECFRRLLHLL